jgi:hypothetical protein
MFAVVIGLLVSRTKIGKAPRPRYRRGITFAGKKTIWTAQAKKEGDIDP